MIDLVEYLGIPGTIAIVIIAFFFVLQITGEILEFKGRVVPEFIKVRKYFQRRKREREALHQITEILPDLKKVPATLENVEILLNDVGSHYSKDNITLRDQWITWVNNKAKEYDTYEEHLQLLQKKLDENNAITLSLLIDNKRNTIIDFASKVVDEGYPVTREQFNRVLKIYNEYEDIIEKHHLTNGEVDIANRIISEAYTTRMENHSFIEDVRGYE